MKTGIKRSQHTSAGYALVMVLVLSAAALLVMAATMRRTGSVAIQNERNNQYVANVNAAEAAVEKVIARLSYDFQQFSAGNVNANQARYRTNIPNESPYWSRFKFSDGQGNDNRIYVGQKSDFTGPLPSQYPGLYAKNAPFYRILANVRAASGPYKNMTNAVQQDVLLALIPLSQYAIFYNGLLEFSTCATMTVNGRTHANSSIYVGTDSSLTFNGAVTTTGTMSSPANNGHSAWTFPGNTVFNADPDYRTNVPTVKVSINMSNTHSFIDFPATGVTPGSVAGQQLLYNLAHVLVLVSNTSVTTKIQVAPSTYQVPGEDPSPYVITESWASTSSWATVQASISTNFPFLTVTNYFLDQREDKTNLTAQIDVAKYDQWITTNANVLDKFPTGSGIYPTILYVANKRTNNANQMTSVRLTNAVVVPSNGGRGWSLATPNPLYVLGNYNCPTAAHLGTTNTSATSPCGLYSDALTILSSAWKDTVSFTLDESGPNAATTDTVNAAIVTGTKPSTGNTKSTFSGGVHNLPRLLEDWSDDHLWLNTSIINLYNTTNVTGQFVTPGSGSYYVPPTRHFSFDNNFLDYNKVPPGMPSALVAIRVNWAVPPPNNVSYNVTP